MSNPLDGVIQQVVAKHLDEVANRGRHSKQKVKASINMHDDRTTQQLKNDRWSGIRANELMGQFEIWILGQIDRSITYGQFYTDPNALTQAYCMAFGIEVELADETARAIQMVKNKKEDIEKFDQLVLRGKKQ